MRRANDEQAAFAPSQDLKVGTESSKYNKNQPVGIMGMIKEQERTQTLLSSVLKELRDQRQQLAVLSKKVDSIALNLER